MSTTTRTPGLRSAALRGFIVAGDLGFRVQGDGDVSLGGLDRQHVVVQLHHGSGDVVEAAVRENLRRAGQQQANDDGVQGSFMCRFMAVFSS